MVFFLCSRLGCSRLNERLLVDRQTMVLEIYTPTYTFLLYAFPRLPDYRHGDVFLLRGIFPEYTQASSDLRSGIFSNGGDM